MGICTVPKCCTTCSIVTVIMAAAGAMVLFFALSDQNYKNDSLGEYDDSCVSCNKGDDTSKPYACKIEKRQCKKNFFMSAKDVSSKYCAKEGSLCKSQGKKFIAYPLVLLAIAALLIGLIHTMCTRFNPCYVVEV